MTGMACNQLVDLVTAYLEGTLPGTERMRFDAHLAECPFCTEYVAQMRATVARLGVLDEGALSPDMRAGLLAAFRDWRG
jgi:anti-sigma factor RsiW